MRANGFAKVSTSGNVHRIAVFRQTLFLPFSLAVKDASLYACINVKPKGGDPEQMWGI